MTGIQRKRELDRLRHLFHRLEHQRLFIYAAHSHINIQDGRSRSLLLFGKLYRPLKTALPQLFLEFLLSGGIDPLANDQEGIGETEGNGLSF